MNGPMKRDLMSKLLVLLLLAALLLSGCGRTAASKESVPAPEAHAAETPVPAEVPAAPAEEPAPAETPVPEPAVPLTADEMQAFTALFDMPEYTGFLEEPFRSPADINWDAVLRCGAGIAVLDLGEEEKNDWLQATGQKILYGDLMAVRNSDLQEYIRKFTGTEPAHEGKILPWDYIAARDSFYRQYWGFERLAYTCVGGERAGDRYTLRFEVSELSAGVDPRGHYGNFADRVLTMTGSGKDYVMESNAFCWDDRCDTAHTFDAQLLQYDTPVRFITYTVKPDEAEIILVKDGRRLTDLSTYIDGDAWGYLKTVEDAVFFDFTADGRSDVAVIGNSDYGRHVLLYTATTDEYAFSYFADLNEQKVATIGADFTVEGVRSALLGGNTEAAPGTWQEAYAQIAKLYHIANETYLFDLIRADGDEIPELVVSYPGYLTSLYTFENGYARCLMDHWPYGAGGNSGYSYLPEMGVYYNGNADYAGAIYYESYMSKHETGELATDYWVKLINFNDLNGDGEPSQEELEASGTYEGSAEYHCETGAEMSQDEIKAVIDGYNGHEWKYLTGGTDYESLLVSLAA